MWSLSPAAAGLYAGVEPAGLFRSDDDGETWRHVAGLREHPSRPHWQPGGGGLILHSLVPHPTDDRQLWVAISSAGVFHTADGGDTWEPRNRGTRADFMPEDQRYPEIGQCVHCLVMAEGMPDRSTSRTTAACIAARMAAGSGTASRRACRRASVFPRRSIRATRTRSICCR